MKKTLLVNQQSIQPGVEIIQKLRPIGLPLPIVPSPTLLRRPHLRTHQATPIGVQGPIPDIILLPSPSFRDWKNRPLIDQRAQSVTNPLHSWTIQVIERSLPLSVLILAHRVVGILLHHLLVLLLVPLKLLFLLGSHFLIVLVVFGDHQVGNMPCWGTLLQGIQLLLLSLKLGDKILLFLLFAEYLGVE